MSRSQFIKTLRQIGDINVPQGHLRRNKGVTTYFFEPSKLDEIVNLLESHGLKEFGNTAGADAVWTENFAGSNITKRRVCLSTHEDYVSCSIIRWES